MSVPVPVKKGSGGKGVLIVLAVVVALGGLAALGAAQKDDAPVAPAVQIDEELAEVQQIVKDGYGEESNRIVRFAFCDRVDRDHFSCDVNYETAEGVNGQTVVSVTCDADRCVWRG